MGRKIDKSQQRKTQKRVKKKRTRQRGGKAAYFVDFKKGYEVTRNLITALKKKTVNVKQAKRTVAGYKREYQEYKRRGGTKGFNSWATDKGYARRDKTCCTQ